MSKFPPKKFILAKSAVDGIQVFMPRPPDEKHEPSELHEPHEEVVEFSCPQCAATTAYSAENGGLTCTYCCYYEPPSQEIVGKNAEEFGFTEETMRRVAHGWGVERKELVCNNCGGHTTLPPEMLTHSCPFCGSNKVIQQKAPQDVLRPRFLIPFSVTEAYCRRKTAVWLKNHWMLPPELKKMARIVDYTPIYIPFWTFDAEANAVWKAEADVNKSSEHVTWVWQEGEQQIYFDDLLTIGTYKVNNTLLARMLDYDLTQMVPYDASFIAGIQAQAYDFELEESWADARQNIRETMKSACKRSIQGKNYYNFSMKVTFSNESWRYILLPVYVTTYRYNNHSWQLLINGQTGQLVGRRPVDWNYVWVVTLALLVPAVIFLSLTQATHLFNFLTPYVTLLAQLAFLSLIIGAIIIKTLFSAAYRIEDI